MAAAAVGRGQHSARHQLAAALGAEAPLQTRLPALLIPVVVAVVRGVTLGLGSLALVALAGLAS